MQELATLEAMSRVQATEVSAQDELAVRDDLDHQTACALS